MNRVKFALTLAALVCVVMTSTGNATAAPGWRYHSSNGMSHCAFAAFGPGGATVNTASLAATPGGVTITGETGKTVTLRLVCERSQSFDNAGQLSALGPEGTYSGPGGGGVAIGVDKPGDVAQDGYTGPRGREWTVAVASTPTTHQLSWAGQSGSDTINVTVQPVTPPASLGYVNDAIEPVQNRADEAYDMAESSGRGWENRVFAFQASYRLGLDSLSNNGDARQGWGLDADVLLGSDPHVRFLTGVTFAMDFRQKPVLSAPNMPTNGFNEFVDWQTYFIAPKAGIEWMPVGVFQLKLWGALGPMVSLDGTVPISQLPDKTDYYGESNTTAAFAGAAQLDLNLVLGDHFTVGTGIGVLGTFTKIPAARGPEQICSIQTNSCLVRRDEHIIDVPWTILKIGGQL